MEQRFFMICNISLQHLETPQKINPIPAFLTFKINYVELSEIVDQNLYYRSLQKHNQRLFTSDCANMKLQKIPFKFFINNLHESINTST